jgi:DNA mismatch endonuclease (patch repair protein)
MSAIRNRDTKIEKILGKIMWSKGLRYRKNDKSVFGKPDFTFKGLKIAIFVDSEYFHGKDWEVNRYKIKTNSEFWQKKIEGNICRDIQVNEELLKNNWKVLRFWGEDIKKNPDICMEQIRQAVDERKNRKIFRIKAKV